MYRRVSGFADLVFTDSGLATAEDGLPRARWPAATNGRTLCSTTKYNGGERR